MPGDCNPPASTSSSGRFYHSAIAAVWFICSSFVVVAAVTGWLFFNVREVNLRADEAARRATAQAAQMERDQITAGQAAERNQRQLEMRLADERRAREAAERAARDARKVAAIER